MKKKLLLDSASLDVTVGRLCRQLAETHGDFGNSALVGLQPRGTFFARYLHRMLETLIKKDILFGLLDITFYRDDLRRKENPPEANATKIDFATEDKSIILIDDVLFTGRSVRAALDALNSFGRPSFVELAVLIDRKYSRELPIAADYVGKYVDSVHSQKVTTEWNENGAHRVWLISE